MKYRPLGKSGISVSEIGFGAWAIGGPVDLFGTPVGWSGVEDRDSINAIERAFDQGINFFDTADVYGSGHSEELLGKVLKGRECVIATKAGNARLPGKAFKDFSESHIRKALESSLKRLRRDWIDVYQLHNPPPDVWQGDEIFSLLDRLREEGKIRVSGVSISRMEEGIHLVRKRKVDMLQVLFNVLNQEPAQELLPLAEKQGVGIVARVPLASGLLTGKFREDHQFDADDNRRNYFTPDRLKECLEKVEKLKELTSRTPYTLPQIALAYLLKFSSVSSAIPGAKNATQVDQNVSATDVEIDDELFHTIRDEFTEFNFYLRYKVKV